MYRRDCEFPPSRLRMFAQEVRGRFSHERAPEIPVAYPLSEEAMRFYHLRWTKPSTGTPKEQAQQATSPAGAEKKSPSPPEQTEPRISGEEAARKLRSDIEHSPPGTKVEKLIRFQQAVKGREGIAGLTPETVEDLINDILAELSDSEFTNKTGSEEEEGAYSGRVEQEKGKKKKKKKKSPSQKISGEEPAEKNKKKDYRDSWEHKMFG